MRIFFILTLLLSNLPFGSAQTLDNPIAYFDYFNQQHGVIVQQNMNYLQVMVHSEDLNQMVAKRLALLQNIEKIQSQLEQLPDYEKDAGMKVALLSVLNTYKELYLEAYLEIEALKPTAQHSFKLMETYMERQGLAEKKLADASRFFLDAQRQFAATNNIVLMEAQASSETEQLNKLNDYQRHLFLSSFRVSKLNAEFLENMNIGDESKLNTSLKDLLDACYEEINEVETIAPFNDNTTYRDAVLRQAKTVQTLAKNDYTILIKGAVNPNSLDQDEAKQYNMVIQKINTTLNPLMMQINDSLQELLRNNVPKPAHRGVKEI